MTETKTISVKGSDLFYISKFHVTKQHHTGFRHSKWWYATTPEDLMGKWVDVSSKDLYILLEHGIFQIADYDYGKESVEE